MNRNVRKALGILAVTALCSMAATNVATSAPTDQSPLAAFSPEIAKELSGLTLADQLGVARTARMMPVLLAVETLPGFVDAGYASSTSDEVEILWHGPVSGELKDAIAKNADPGTEVTIKNLDFTAEEVDQLIDVVAAKLDDAKISYDSIGPTLKYGSFEIVLLNAEESIEEAERIAKSVESPLEIKVTNRNLREPAFGEDFVSTYETRVTDVGALDTGVTVQVNSDDGYGYCTTGLSYTRAGYGDYQLMAAHCSGFENDQEVYSASGATQYGTSRGLGIFWGDSNGNSDQSGPRLDAGLLDLTTKTTSNKIWVGEWDTDLLGEVNGTSTIPYGTSMCSSSGATGLNCGIERAAAQALTCITYNSSGACTRYAKTVLVDSMNDTIMFGQGDSGGPIYTYSNYDRHITSIVEGGTPGWQVSCGSASHYANTICSIYKGKVTAISSITTALNGLGFVIRQTN